MGSRPYTRQHPSGKPGVTWRAKLGKWHARITVAGKTILLGNYTNLYDAIAAREHAERQHDQRNQA